MSQIQRTFIRDNGDTAIIHLFGDILFPKHFSMSRPDQDLVNVLDSHMFLMSSRTSGLIDRKPLHFFPVSCESD